MCWIHIKIWIESLLFTKSNHFHRSEDREYFCVSLFQGQTELLKMCPGRHSFTSPGLNCITCHFLNQSLQEEYNNYPWSYLKPLFITDILFCPSTNKNEIHRIYTIPTYSIENQYDTLSGILRRNKRMVMYNKIIHISGYK